MNTIPFTAQNLPPRLKRIRMVSRFFRALIAVLAGVMIILTALCGLIAIKSLLGSEQPTAGTMTITFSPNQVYASPFQIPLGVFLLGAGQFGLGGYGLILLNRLFRLYERGQFFQSENIRCIKWLGLITLGIWFSQTLLEFMALKTNLEGTGLVCGLLILLIGWIMDEGRKLQEEQALTV